MMWRMAFVAAAVHFDKGEPTKGANRVSIAVNDAHGKVVPGLQQVRVDYFMPSLSGKQPMMEKSTVAFPVGRTYEATLSLSMKGEWAVAVSIVTPSITERTTFRYVVK
jgi:hypothetical protein